MKRENRNRKDGGSPDNKKPEINRKQLRTLIHQKIDELRSGDLFMEFNLTEKHYPFLLSEEENFLKFEEALGKSLAQIDNAQNPDNRLNGGKLNRKKKKFVEAVRSDSKFVKSEIKIHQNTIGSSSNTNAQSSTPCRKQEWENESEFEDIKSENDDIESIEHNALDKEPSKSPKNHKISVKKNLKKKGHKHNNDVEFTDENTSKEPPQRGKLSKKKTKKASSNNSDVESTTEKEILQSSTKPKKKSKKNLKYKSTNSDNNFDTTELNHDNVATQSLSKKHKKKKSKKKLSNKDRNVESIEDNTDNEDTPQTSHKKAKTSKKLKNKKLKDKQEEHMLKEYHGIESDDEEYEEVNNNVEDDEDINELEMMREKAETEFNTEKEAILQQIDESIKHDFREVGFGKWQRAWLPIIQLGPYDVMSGSVRDEWLKTYEKTTKGPRLVFWYGTPKENLTFGFSFLPESEIVSYSKGVEKGINKVSTKVKKKLESGKKLTKVEQLIFDGLKELEDDLPLSKEKRLSWLIVTEDYEVEFPSVKNKESKKQKKRKNQKVTIDNDMLDDKSVKKKGKKVVNEAHVLDSSEGMKTPKKKKQKKKKNKHSDISSKERLSKKSHKRKNTEIDELSVKKETGESKKRRKKDEGILSKSEPQERDQCDSSIKDTSLDPDVPRKETKKKKRLKKKEDLKVKVEVNVNVKVDDKPEYSFSDENIPSDESDDENFSLSDQNLSVDELYHDEGIKEAKSKKKTKRKEKKGRKEAQEKNALKEAQGKTAIEDAQEKFEKCQKVLVPIIKNLESAAKSNNTHIVKKNLQFIKENVYLVTPSFVKEYLIGIIVKKTREKYAKNNDIKSQCKVLTTLLKNQYHKKENIEPEGFRPKLKQEKLEPKDDKNVHEANTPQVKKDDEIEAEVITQKVKEEKPESNNRKIDQAVLRQEEISRKKPDSVVKKESIQTIKVEKKPTKRIFSLANILDPKLGNLNNKKVTEKMISQTKSKSELPEWLTSNLPRDDSFNDNQDRNFAMEFFLEAVAGLSKINQASMARALEAALFEKYGSVNKTYWERVHDICAAIVGKNGLGSLAKKIMEGAFATPMEIIDIPLDVFYRSFEGNVIS